MKKAMLIVGLFLGAALAPSQVYAHFIWVALETNDSDGKEAHVYFGEIASPDSAELLDRIKNVVVWRRSDSNAYIPVRVSKVETDEGGSLAARLPKAADCIEADCLYGVFSRGERSMLLHYYAKALDSRSCEKLGRSRKLDFDVVPKLTGGKLRLTTLWMGKPVKGCQVVVSQPKGEGSESQTDADGVASVDVPMPGRYEIRARLIQEKSGVHENVRYTQSRHYCTLTLDVAAEGLTVSASLDEHSRRYPSMTKGITSFGAAVIGDWLYVYGGHFGRAHHYSNTSQSNELRRLNLNHPNEWESIATGTRLQGLALVARKGKLYRIGGFTAHNDEGEEHDLRSVADVVQFHPETKEWTSLAPLPEPRSSHDAVVIGDQLYVVGGWQLGPGGRKWHDSAWVMDLSHSDPKWIELPKPPFQRRALSLGHLDGKLYAIGGMQNKGGPTTRVDMFDPSTGKWSRQHDLNGEGMEGFGSSAFAVGGRLFVSTYGGNLQCLNGEGADWCIAAKLKEDRFFHRMLPFHQQLVLVGGASMEAGKRLDIETVNLGALK